MAACFVLPWGFMPLIWLAGGVNGYFLMDTLADVWAPDVAR